MVKTRGSWLCFREGLNSKLDLTGFPVLFFFFCSEIRESVERQKNLCETELFCYS